MQIRQVALVGTGTKVREDAPLADQVRAWSEAVRRLSPARDRTEFTAAQATIAAGLRHLAARLEGCP